MAEERDAPDGLKSGLRRPGPAAGIEHQRVRLRPVAIVDVQVQRRADFPEMLAQHPLHEVPHAEGGVHPAQQVLPGGLRRIDRQIHQEARLDILLGFLHQPDLAGNADRPLVPRLVHRCPAHRLGIHVVAESPLVAPVEGLQINDGRIGIPYARRMDVVLRKALGADLREVRVLFRRRYPQRKPHALNAGKSLADVQRPDVIGKLPALEQTGGREQSVRAFQNLLVFAHALIDVPDDLVDPKVELVVQFMLRIFAHVPLQDIGHRQAQNEDQRGNQGERAKGEPAFQYPSRVQGATPIPAQRVGSQRIPITSEAEAQARLISVPTPSGVSTSSSSACSTRPSMMCAVFTPLLTASTA